MDYEIEAVRPTKKKGAVVANAIVIFEDTLLVRFKLVNGPKGLFLGMPSVPYGGSNGVRSHVSYAKVLDDELLERLERDVLDAYERRLEEDGRKPPKPLPRKPNRIKELIKAAAEHSTNASVKQVVDTLCDALDDKTLTSRETITACWTLMRLKEARMSLMAAAARAYAEEARQAELAQGVTMEDARELCGVG